MELVPHQDGGRQGDGFPERKTRGGQCDDGKLLDRNQPIFPTGQIELQCHGNPVYFRNIYLREIPRGQ
jgi:hypothetical protein